ncbi:GNAT family N-acetyltransferase [Paenibacillus flagellatus]|uniref:GNAT family N-acetyltransferase n=1 Tax=Paenibacillus flagellatus TaxID=2211139 RepID=A0A2V5K1X3_9BACL|nr:GNAT family N-acetyltransferase [Paenibacillus flagellatus]PYI53141.1 GNAT family N-acetyltransferase [Paenibacillus flagellatus]
MASGIIPFEDQHYDELVAIWYRAVRQTHTFLAEADFEFYHRLVREGALKAAELWVEVDEGRKPRGFIGLEGAKIEMLFVDPGHFGRGIGTRLIRYAEARKGGDLQVDVNEQNEGARLFYSRYGFVQTGRSERDASGRPYPLLHMALNR